MVPSSAYHRWIWLLGLLAVFVAACTVTEVRHVEPTVEPRLQSTVVGERVCPDAPPSPFTVGRRGYICNTDRIILREKASPRARDLAHMEPGAKFVVIGGPECGDRRVWWQVRFQGNDQPYNNGWVGWMPESDPGGSELYLCPLP